MPTASNAKLDYEAGQNSVAISALSDSGDAKIFESAASLFSRKSGYEPVVLPDGLVTGGVAIPAVSTTSDMIDVAALTANVNGALKSVSAATDETITRVVGNDYALISSVTVTAAGAIAIIAGTDGTDGNFVETRDVAGGPPYIPVTSIEIAQVRLNTQAAAAILPSEIFAVVGAHTERYDYPLYNKNYDAGTVEFLSALPLIHTAGVPKTVYASYSSPIFSQISLAADFKPAETAHSVSSTQVYGTTLGAASSSLGQGGFSAYLQDGITDGLVALKNEILWFRFYPDRAKAPYTLTQGALGISRQFPAGDNIVAECTISADTASLDKAS